jgi:HEAT repeat protein
LLAIKFLALACPGAKEAIPALDRMREDPKAEVRKQAQAASDRIKSKAKSSQENGNARKTASTRVFGSTTPRIRLSGICSGKGGRSRVACPFSPTLKKVKRWSSRAGRPSTESDDRRTG